MRILIIISFVLILGTLIYHHLFTPKGPLTVYSYCFNSLLPTLTSYTCSQSLASRIIDTSSLTSSYYLLFKTHFGTSCSKRCWNLCRYTTKELLFRCDASSSYNTDVCTITFNFKTFYSITPSGGSETIISQMILQDSSRKINYYTTDKSGVHTGTPVTYVTTFSI